MASARNPTTAGQRALRLSVSAVLLALPGGPRVTPWTWPGCSVEGGMGLTSGTSIRQR